MPSFDALLREKAPIYRPRGIAWHVVAVVSVGAFMGQLDVSIVTLALPTLETTFHESIAAVSWVAVAYLLTLIALLAVFGRLADLHGRKMLYTYGFLVFIAGSAACGAAPTFLTLILARAFQGIGAAMLQANSIAIITAAIPRDRLGRAIGLQGAAQALGLSAGPALGGLLIATLGWRWVFYINVPAGIVAAALGWLLLPATARDPLDEPFDWVGALLFAPAVVALMLFLTFGQTLGWSSPASLVLSAATVLFSWLFVRDQRRESHPLVDLSLFRRAGFAIGVLGALLSYTVLFGAFFLMPFFLERVRHHDPAQTGLLLIPVPAALSLAAPLGGWLADRFGSRIPAVLGMGMATLALALLALTHRDTQYLSTAGALALLGLGIGLFTPPNNSSIMAAAPLGRLGVAGGVLNTTRGLGTALGIAATGAVLGFQLASLAGGASSTLAVSPHLLAVAFRHSLWFLTGLAALGALVASVRGTSGVPAEPKQQKSA